MREFIFKAIIITFIAIVAFEFTIGKRIDPVVGIINKFSDEQGRKELIRKLRKYMLKEDDRVLIYNFFNKLKSEINSAEKN